MKTLTSYSVERTVGSNSFPLCTDESALKMTELSESLSSQKLDKIPKRRKLIEPLTRRTTMKTLTSPNVIIMQGFTLISRLEDPGRPFQAHYLFFALLKNKKAALLLYNSYFFNLTNKCTKSINILWKTFYKLFSINFLRKGTSLCTESKS